MIETARRPSGQVRATARNRGPRSEAAPHIVARKALVAHLCRSRAEVVTVTGPAGFGKTTLLAQWAESETRTVVSINFAADRADRLVASVVRARDRLRRGAGVLVLLDGFDLPLPPAVVAEVGELVAARAAGSTIVVAARTEPPLPIGGLRAAGTLVEIGAEDLAFDADEVRLLHRKLGLLLPDPELAELVRRTEGWPAAVYLAGLALRAGGTVDSFGGDDRFVSEFLETECLAALPTAQRRFLAETSVLERLSAELCDAVCDRAGSSRMLEKLAAANLIVRLDNQRRWYRQRLLVRGALRAELERNEPELIATLHLRAAEWWESHGDLDGAFAHAAASNDAAELGRLLEGHSAAFIQAGRAAHIERWFDALDGSDELARRRAVVVAGSWAYALRGRSAESRRWADLAATADAVDDPLLDLLSALRCAVDVPKMLADSAAACAKLAQSTPWYATALLAGGVAEALLGNESRADAVLADAAECAAASGAVDVQALAVCERALLATARGSQGTADALAAEADGLSARNDASASGALIRAVAARSALRNGFRDLAIADVERAEELRSLLTHAVPWLAAQATIELAQAQVALFNADAVRVLLREADDLLRTRPGLAMFAPVVADLRRKLLTLDEPGGRWASSLTPAELRLLPLLATHLSFREIGERLFVSRNTVKTQAISVYRKLGVTSRSSAIGRANALGLVEVGSGPRGLARTA